MTFLTLQKIIIMKVECRVMGDTTDFECSRGPSMSVEGTVINHDEDGCEGLYDRQTIKNW